MSVKYLFKERLEAIWNFGLQQVAGKPSSDNQTESPNSVSTDKTVSGVVRGAFPMLKRAALISVFVNLVGLFPAIFSLQVYDRVIYRSGLNTLTALLIGMAIILSADLILRSFRARVLRVAAVRIDGDIAGRLMNKLLAIPLRNLEARSTAAWYSLFKDVDTVRVVWSGAVAMTILDLPFAILSIGLIATIALPLLPVVLVGLACLATLSWYSSGEFRKRRVEEFMLARRRDEVLAEVCRGREAIKSLVQDESAKRAWVESYNSWVHESFQKNGEMEDQRELSTSIMLSVNVLITAVGAFAVIHQWMTVGGLIASNMLASKAIGPLASLSGHWRSIAHSREATDRLDAVFASEEEKQHTGLNLPLPSGALRLESVSYQHVGAQKSVLNSVSVQLGPRGIYGVAGDNGAGKSTLLKILRGLYTPSEGRVLLDEYDLSQFSRQELSKWVGFLPQTSLLFEGTIVDNLRRSNPDATDEQILLAAKRSGAHDFIAKLPDGYMTQVGEGGNRMSGGQRRRIAITQAFLSDAPVLLLDEPTNDLDFATETHLMAVFRSLAATKTIVMVTHSVRLMSICDKIVYLDKESRLHLGSTPEMLKLLYGISLPKPAVAAPAQAVQHGVAPAVAHQSGADVDAAASTGGKAAQA
ncbi:MAG TPA: ATP-binding cassette domain-containing protein [Limnobacter sp.]|uniref:peptidase domain-containing ABC transporter n=1 Tax=Limnobacter sp. TaxID=2003368 RepID=UPI002E31ECD9|nr:ATP-binding cassette domain-containing protein [Limnobacter sp.]HEX5485086.1 ATP-binding cassette domain-containing protein [Limnobacter sp.]